MDNSERALRSVHKYNKLMVTAVIITLVTIIVTGKQIGRAHV